MPSLFKHLAGLAVIGAILTLSGCATNPDGSLHINTQDLHNKLVYDLKKTNRTYAENELKNRGYYLSGRDGSRSWWYSSEYKYCYELEEKDGKVKDVNYRSSSACQKAPQKGNNNGYNQGGNNYNNNQNYNNNDDAPQTAKGACIKRFGVYNYDRIVKVSPIKPGYWEIIVKGKKGRHVACTVDDYGSINDWVDM